MYFPGVSTPLRYDKQQLVPFGEFIPYRNLIPVSVQNAFQFFQYDVRAGKDSIPFRFYDPAAGNVAAGPFICYESMYPIYCRAMTRSGANLLITQSNDAWFQSSAAMEQHLAAVVLRAVENRRDVVRSTTSGVTCLLDSYGRVLERAPERREATIVAKVHLLTGESIYTRFGDWFVALCGLVVVGLVMGAAQKRREGDLGAGRRGETRALL
jgi:apolipoprotein N-acyltransferase